MKTLPALLSLILLATLPGCGKNDAVAPVAAKPAAADVERVPLEGVVVAVKANKTLLINHKDLHFKAGVMPGMTMEFSADDAVLKAAKKGDLITAEVVGADEHLENVKLTPGPTPPTPPTQ